MVLLREESVEAPEALGQRAEVEEVGTTDFGIAQALIGAPGSARRLAVVEAVTFVGTELHKVFSPWLWHKETADSTRQAVKDKLALRFKELDALFAKQDWIAGDYSIADMYAFTILNWTKFLHLSLAEYPKLQAYLQRVAARPAVQAALQAERHAK